MKRLIKSRNFLFTGVCGGIADYIGIDAILVRLAFIIGLMAYGLSAVIYVILMLLIPSK